MSIKAFNTISPSMDIIKIVYTRTRFCNYMRVFKSLFL